MKGSGLTFPGPGAGIPQYVQKLDFKHRGDEKEAKKRFVHEGTQRETRKEGLIS